MVKSKLKPKNNFLNMSHDSEMLDTLRAYRCLIP